MGKTKKTWDFMPTLRKIGLIRILIMTVIGLVGAWFTLSLAIAGVTRTRNPPMALMILPRESTALAARADQVFFENPNKPAPAAKALALAALREQAINPKALRLLGYFASLENDLVKAEKLVRMAQRLSRREAGAQLWLIEFAAQKDDTKQALFHFDVVLKTKPETQDLLFPRLLSAIDDASVREALKPYIGADNDWAGSFVSYANAKSTNLPALASLVAETGGVGDRKIAQQQRIDLLARLVGEKYFNEAQALFLKIPGAKPARLTSAALDPSDRDGRFGSMGWQLFNEPDAGGGFNAQTKNSSITFSVFANGSTTRTVARKLLYLRPGSYTFASKLADLDRGDGGFLRWQLSCPAEQNATPIWSVSSISKVTQSGLSVPASCSVQFLDLILSGGKGQIGLEATIASVSVTPSK